jgi:hypothetical protein
MLMENAARAFEFRKLGSEGWMGTLLRGAQGHFGRGTRPRCFSLECAGRYCSSPVDEVCYQHS